MQEQQAAACHPIISFGQPPEGKLKIMKTNTKTKTNVYFDTEIKKLIVCFGEWTSLSSAVAGVGPG